MRRVQVTSEAVRDLNDLWDYIAKDNADAADRVKAVIRANFEKLAEFPGIGHRRDELDPACRVWRVYSYLIIYRDQGDAVQIIRVVSGYRNLKRLKV